MRGERFLFRFYLGFFLFSSRQSRGNGHHIIPDQRGAEFLISLLILILNYSHKRDFLIQKCKMLAFLRGFGKLEI
jgi:hypothetical protein